MVVLSIQEVLLTGGIKGAHLTLVFKCKRLFVFPQIEI